MKRMSEYLNKNSIVLHSGKYATYMASVMSYQECMQYCLYSGCEDTDSGC